GSGKTAAFSLPIMNNLIHDYQMPEKNHPKVLIIAPTRELVMQIGKFIDTFSRGTPLKSLVVAGGQPYQPQIRKLKYGVDILISTPGRLIDHMGSGTVKLGKCHTFILDEADRMLDMGFIDEVKEMQAALREDHQTVMFSATMNDKVRKLSMALLKEPEFVEQERKTMVAETISHKLMNVRRKNKIDLLVQILQDETIEKALVFSRTKLGADNICGLLKEAFRDTPVRVDSIHGDKKQRTREKILLNFRKGRTKVLVATDVAARGIDVDGISHVINYELPIEAENYVHRVGRTGRAGQSGIAISFCDPSDMRLLKEIEHLIKLPIEVDEDHKYHFDISDMREFKKGGRNKGKFDKSRGRTKKTNTESRRPKFRKEGANENRPSNDSRPSNNKRPARQEGFRKTEHKKSDVNKPEAKRYDPWQGSQGFEDDPVIKKLMANKPSHVKKDKNAEPPIKSKKNEDFKGKKNKKFGKKSDKPARGKKYSENKGRANNNDGKISGNRDASKLKQTGGHKTFSPKRKTLKANHS
ncbi:MAG: DEAD/DEAH box helicase, partial [Kordiimonadaceae bacterium]|nr:DEAD/DEAH box helicase [Kordiimonadaceae bacterium]